MKTMILERMKSGGASAKKGAARRILRHALGVGVALGVGSFLLICGGMEGWGGALAVLSFVCLWADDLK